MYRIQPAVDCDEVDPLTEPSVAMCTIKSKLLKKGFDWGLYREL